MRLRSGYCMVENWIKVREKDGNCMMSFWNVDIILDDVDVRYLMKLLYDYQCAKEVCV